MADLSCTGSCMKCILFFFNIIFFLSGAAVLGAGIWAKVDDDIGEYITIIDFDDGNPYFDQAVWIMIAIGAFIFLVGFLGCCGACYESSCMLALYATFLILIICAQIAAAALIFVFKDNLGSEFEFEMGRQANQDVSANPTENDITKAWYAMQYQLQCCGGFNYTDYRGSLFRTQSADSNDSFLVPPTCCKMSNFSSSNPVADNQTACDTEAGGREPDPTNPQLYQDGCYDSLVNWIEDNIYILIGVALGIAALEILGIIFACCVRSEINDPGVYK